MIVVKSFTYDKCHTEVHLLGEVKARFRKEIMKKWQDTWKGIMTDWNITAFRMQVNLFVVFRRNKKVETRLRLNHTGPNKTLLLKSVHQMNVSDVKSAGKEWNLEDILDTAEQGERTYGKLRWNISKNVTRNISYFFLFIYFFSSLLVK